MDSALSQVLMVDIGRALGRLCGWSLWKPAGAGELVARRQSFASQPASEP